MKVALLSEKNNAFRAALCDVMREHNHTVDVYSGEFLEAANLEGYDLAVLKTKKPKFLAAAHRAKGHGVRVIPDPVVAEEIRNRVLCDRLMQKAGIPCPPSIYEKQGKLFQDMPQDFLPAVKKPLMSSGGRGIELIEGIQDLASPEDASEPIYLQQLILGTHFVVYFIGEDIYAFQKTAHVGTDTGDVAPVPVWDDLRHVVNSFKKATGLKWGDLDVVVSDNTRDTYSVDPGSFPSFKLIPKSPNDIALQIVSLIEKECQSESDKERINKPAAAGSGQCKKCVAFLVKLAKERSMYFRSLHMLLAFLIKSFTWLYRIKPNKADIRNSNCGKCLRFAKNQLKERSLLFQWLNKIIDPYFDNLLLKLVSADEMQKAKV